MCIRDRHYTKQHSAPLYGPRIALNFQDFKRLAGDKTVARYQHTHSTTYEMDWYDVQIESVVYPKVLNSDTISIRDEVVLGSNDG